MVTHTEFRKALEGLINEGCMENGSNTPDYILATFLSDCLKTFDEAVAARDRYFRHPLPAGAKRPEVCQSTCNEGHTYDVTCGMFRPS